MSVMAGSGALIVWYDLGFRNIKPVILNISKIFKDTQLTLGTSFILMAISLGLTVILWWYYFII